MFDSTHSFWVITSSGWKDNFEDCHFSMRLFCFEDLSCSMLDVKFPFKALICRQTLFRLRFVNVNFIPSVPIQFVIPRVEDRDKSWWMKVGFCIKREVVENKDLNLKLFWNWVCKRPAIINRVVFFLRYMFRNQRKAMIALLPQTHRHSFVFVVC